MGYLLHPQQDLKRVSVKDAQFIGVITSMAALRKTDVYAFAQCSQLFPSPSEYRCADSQILTHAKAFEEYFHPSPFLKRKKKSTSSVHLWNRLISIRLALSSLQVLTHTVRAAIIIFILIHVFAKALSLEEKAVWGGKLKSWMHFKAQVRCFTLRPCWIHRHIHGDTTVFRPQSFSTKNSQWFKRRKFEGWKTLWTTVGARITICSQLSSASDSLIN